MAQKFVYLMRGLPSCGKSHMARRLASDLGVVLETDEYFFVEVGDDLLRYDYDARRLDDARRWNFKRFREAIAEGISPIVVDRGNGLNLATQQYARYAVDHGYLVELKEPDAPWWLEIRELLRSKHLACKALDAWADKLAAMSRGCHRVPASTIRRWMDRWQSGVTVEQILQYGAAVKEIGR